MILCFEPEEGLCWADDHRGTEGVTTLYDVM
jgi:hypothetical protein